VRALPTSFGPVSYSIEAAEGSVRVSLDVPRRGAIRTLGLRLRLPAGSRLARVAVDGRPYARFRPGTETIELPTRPGRMALVAGVSQG
jgi:hypothetical protein